MKYKQIKNFKNFKHINLISHSEPDADALCSTVVFKHFLEQKFKAEVNIFAEYTTLPESYACVIKGQNLNEGAHECDCAIMMDAPKTDRLGVYESIFLSAPNTMVIDHHATNQFDRKANIVEVVSSTCEIVYYILKEWKHNFTKEDYAWLYAGIVTDTNNLTVGARSSRTFVAVGECVDNVETYPIYENFMLNNTKQNMDMMALAIQNANYYAAGKIIISHISKQQAKAMGATQDSYTGIINRLSTIHGVRLVGFIYPKQGEYYVSMRGRAGCNVGQIAQANGGGGHAGAAAFLCDEPINKTEAKLLKKFELELKNAPNNDGLF